MKQQPIVAFLYDFDKTLCTTDMEDYAFIPALGYTPEEFWRKANTFGRENRMDGLLAYMYTMIEECRKKGIRLDRDYLVSCGHAIELFPGVHPEPNRYSVHFDTYTFDKTPIMDRVGDIVVATGFSAHGFKMAPAVGKLCAQLATTGESKLMHDTYTIARHEPVHALV